MSKKLAILFTFLLFLGCSENLIFDDTFPKDLTTEWALVEIRIEEDVFLEESREDTELIKITFQDDGMFKGETTRNAFGGKYTISSRDLLLFRNLITTEVLETTFGMQFYRVFNRAYDGQDYPFEFSFGEGELFLKSLNGDEMLFERN
ncbi:MAG: hypothetical protein AAGC43_00070 [Bacteroidota bacterium]